MRNIFGAVDAMSWKSGESIMKQTNSVTTTVPKYLGASSDLRTGRWEVTCPKCGTVFKPNTTKFARQHLECPRMKCMAEMIADYNNDIVTLC